MVGNWSVKRLGRKYFNFINKKNSLPAYSDIDVLSVSLAESVETDQNISVAITDNTRLSCNPASSCVNQPKCALANSDVCQYPDASAISVNTRLNSDFVNSDDKQPSALAYSHNTRLNCDLVNSDDKQPDTLSNSGSSQSSDALTNSDNTRLNCDLVNSDNKQPDVFSNSNNVQPNSDKINCDNTQSNHALRESYNNQPPCIVATSDNLRSNSELADFDHSKSNCDLGLICNNQPPVTGVNSVNIQLNRVLENSDYNQPPIDPATSDNTQPNCASGHSAGHHSTASKSEANFDNTQLIDATSTSGNIEPKDAVSSFFRSLQSWADEVLSMNPRPSDTSASFCLSQIDDTSMYLENSMSCNPSAITDCIEPYDAFISQSSCDSTDIENIIANCALNSEPDVSLATFCGDFQSRPVLCELDSTRLSTFAVSSDSNKPGEHSSTSDSIEPHETFTYLENFDNNVAGDQNVSSATACHNLQSSPVLCDSNNTQSSDSTVSVSADNAGPVLWDLDETQLSSISVSDNIKLGETLAISDSIEPVLWDLDNSQSSVTSMCSDIIKHAEFLAISDDIEPFEASTYLANFDDTGTSILLKSDPNVSSATACGDHQSSTVLCDSNNIQSSGTTVTVSADTSSSVLWDLDNTQLSSISVCSDDIKPNDTLAISDNIEPVLCDLDNPQSIGTEVSCDNNKPDGYLSISDSIEPYDTFTYPDNFDNTEANVSIKSEPNVSSATAYGDHQSSSVLCDSNNIQSSDTTVPVSADKSSPVLWDLDKPQLSSISVCSDDVKPGQPLASSDSIESYNAFTYPENFDNTGPSCPSNPELNISYGTFCCDLQSNSVLWDLDGTQSSDVTVSSDIKPSKYLANSDCVEPCNAFRYSENFDNTEVSGSLKCEPNVSFASSCGGLSSSPVLWNLDNPQSSGSEMSCGEYKPGENLAISDNIESRGAFTCSGDFDNVRIPLKSQLNVSLVNSSSDLQPNPVLWDLDNKGSISVSSDDIKPVLWDLDNNRSISVSSDDIKPVLWNLDNNHSISVSSDDIKPVLWDLDNNRSISVSSDDIKPVLWDLDINRSISVSSDDIKPVLWDLDNNRNISVSSDDIKPVLWDWDNTQSSITSMCSDIIKHGEHLVISDDFEPYEVPTNFDNIEARGPLKCEPNVSLLTSCGDGRSSAVLWDFDDSQSSTTVSVYADDMKPGEQLLISDHVEPYDAFKYSANFNNFGGSDFLKFKPNVSPASFFGDLRSSPVLWNLDDTQSSCYSEFSKDIKTENLSMISDNIEPNFQPCVFSATSCDDFQSSTAFLDLDDTQTCDVQTYSDHPQSSATLEYPCNIPKVGAEAGFSAPPNGTLTSDQREINAFICSNYSQTSGAQTFPHRLQGDPFLDFYNAANDTSAFASSPQKCDTQSYYQSSEFSDDLQFMDTSTYSDTTLPSVPSLYSGAVRRNDSSTFSGPVKEKYLSLSVDTNNNDSLKGVEKLFFDSVRNELHQCSMCLSRKTFKTKAALKVHEDWHVMELFNERPPYQCMICSTYFLRKDHLRKHVMRCHKEDPYQCIICPSAFKKSSHLNYHFMQCHNKARPYQCIICPSTFKRPDYLRKHVKNCHDQAQRYQCAICPSDYKGKGGLSFHIMKCHNAVRTYQCKICLSKFKCLDYLRKHVKLMHNEMRRYQCTICSTILKTKSALKYHEASHDEFRPHQCEICPHKAKRKHVLKAHIKSHDKRLAYQCDICSYTTVSMSDLNKHVKRHWKTRP